MGIMRQTSVALIVVLLGILARGGWGGLMFRGGGCGLISIIPGVDRVLLWVGQMPLGLWGRPRVAHVLDMVPTVL